MASPRVLKLADQIKVIVAEMLERRIKDPRLGFVTITDVRLTGDTQNATVFYTVFGSPEEQAGTAAALESANGLIRSQVAKQLGLRHAPTVAFIPDAVPENARQIDELLAQARTGDAKVAEQAASASYAGEADPYKRPEDETENDSERLSRAPACWSSTSRPAGPRTRSSAGSDGCWAPARSDTPAPSIRWPPACWSSASIAPPDCSGT